MATINTYSNSITVSTTETDLVNVSESLSPYAIWEGYIDISQMPTDAVLKITEYIEIPTSSGTSGGVFMSITLNGKPDYDVIRFHSKIVPNGGTYRVTVQLVSGTSFTLNYWFAETGLI